MSGRFLIFLLLCLFLAAAPAAALEHVVLKVDGQQQTLSGRLLVSAQDGGLMVLTADGRICPVQPEELVSKKSTDEPFVPLNHEQMEARMKSELPDGFRFHHTKHYLICYGTSEAYAEWCGALFERLYGAFTNYWTQRDIELKEPEFPLVAVVFPDRNSFEKYARPELGDAVGNVIGYYSFKTNLMTMYDLTGIEALRMPGSKGSSADITRMLSQPKAERTVATVVHEATHQIAFNTGLQTRYADNPLWVSEGLAIYFESPDLKSRKGWRNIGGINRFQLQRFARYAATRQPVNSLKMLVTDDRRLRDPQTSGDCYAESWALNYYLIRARTKQYQAYLKMLSEKPVAVWDEPEERLKAFTEHFGDLADLDRDFMRYMRRLRP